MLKLYFFYQFSSNSGVLKRSESFTNYLPISCTSRLLIDDFHQPSAAEDQTNASFVAPDKTKQTKYFIEIVNLQANTSWLPGR